MIITSDDYVDKKIEAKQKWNQINLISMEYVLGCNCRIPLLHMSKRKVYIEITNERINEFSFAYMCNPHLPGPLFKGHEVTQDETDFDKDKKVSSTIEGRGLTTMHVTLHPLLDTPPKFDNKQDYKGDTHDETPDSI